MLAPEATLFHQSGSPLVEVFSVWIHNDVDDGHIPRKMSGKIHVTNEFKDSFTLYDRKSEESETVGGPNGDGDLSLRNPHCDGDGGFKGMPPGSEHAIRVDLEDISHGVIVRGTLTTYYVSPDCYDKPCVARFDYATIYWTTLRAAALARVSVSYVGDEGSLRGVHGSLFACYESDCGRFCKPEEEKYFRVTLFDKRRHESADEMESDALLGLTRSVLAVPAHSSIVIKGCLWDADGEIIGVEAEFQVQTCGEKSLVIEDRIKVEVQFEHGQTPSS